MTLDELRQVDRDFLTPMQVSKVLGCSDQQLRLQARHRPDLLGFPVICIGNRVKIPKLPFLAYMEGGRPYV